MLDRIPYILVLVIILLSIGTVYYNKIENWSYVDSFYFSTMTLTTIGFGDLVPTKTTTKIFTSFYAMFGIGIMLYFLGSIIGGYLSDKESLFNKLINRLNNLSFILKPKKGKIKEEVKLEIKKKKK